MGIALRIDIILKIAPVGNQVEISKRGLWQRREKHQCWMRVESIFLKNQATGNQSVEKMTIHAGKPPAKMDVTVTTDGNAPHVTAKPGEFR
jgi:hypothetical protein